MVGIYKITSPTNKIYIGQSWQIEKRIVFYKNLCCVDQRKLYNSLKKYGWNKHKFEVLEEFDDLIEQKKLDNREIFWMKYYSNDGFTLLNIKEGGLGGKLSIETKKIMSNNRKGELNPMYGKTHSDEVKEKISNAHSGKTIQKKQRNILRKKMMGELNPMYGKTHSDEVKEKLRIEKKELFKNKINHPMYGKNHTNETKKMLSNINKGKKLSIETKSKISIKLKNKKKSENQIVKRQKKVIQFDLMLNKIAVWDSIKIAGDSLGISKSSICLCCKNKIKTAGNYVWEYLNIDYENGN
jgi:group I intron endonuclease